MPNSSRNLVEPASDQFQRGPNRRIVRRRVAVVTGTRAEYGLLRSTLAALDAEPRIELQLVVTGMHLLRKFGSTLKDIQADGRRIAAKIPMQTGADDALDQARGLARGVAGIARFLERARTEIVLVLGDRIEALAGALAGVTTGRVVAHVHGGDVAEGDFDDSLRHAITKLAHVHLAATRAAARRIARLGENPWRVHCVGAPGLDDLKELLRPNRDRQGAGHIEKRSCSCRVGCAHRFYSPEKKGGIAHPTFSKETSSGAALVVFHPRGRPAAVEERAMTNVLEAVRAAGLRRRIIYPNSDRGHQGIIRAIERHARQDTARHNSEKPGVCHCSVSNANRGKSPRRPKTLLTEQWHTGRFHCDERYGGVIENDRGLVEIFRSLPREAYLRALLQADVLIGNSSSGLLEAPFAGTPVVNVGPRQAGRQPGGPAVFHADESPASLRAALRKALRANPPRGHAGPYGDGNAGRRIARILASLLITPHLVRKRIIY